MTEQTREKKPSTPGSSPRALDTGGHLKYKPGFPDVGSSAWLLMQQFNCSSTIMILFTLRPATEIQIFWKRWKDDGWTLSILHERGICWAQRMREKGSGLTYALLLNLSWLSTRRSVKLASRAPAVGWSAKALQSSLASENLTFFK